MPIHIGDYCFISTHVTILGGSAIPNKSILGAGAVLNKNYSVDAPYGLYIGVSAYRKSTIDCEALYFHRIERDVI